MYEFLASIIGALNNLVHNYGIAIILFTIIIRVLIFPLNLKSRVGMRKMQELQPKMQALQKKYANDKEKLNQKISELYRKEGANPLSGCLPMLLSFPILIIMFGAMRMVANTELTNQVFAFLSGQTPNYEGFLWIKNLWMPDSPFYPIAPTVNILKTIPANEWMSNFQALSQTTQSSIMAAVPNLNFADANFINTIMEALQANPEYISATLGLSGWQNINLFLVNLSVFMHNNGFLLLPILAAVTQVLMTKLMPQTPTAEGAPNGGAFMKWFFPLFSLYICLNYNASFALYWVAANVFSAVEAVVINKIMDKKDNEAKAITDEEGTVV